MGAPHLYAAVKHSNDGGQNGPSFGVSCYAVIVVLAGVIASLVELSI